MTARVRGVTAAATAAGSTRNVSGSTSTSTARAPQSSTTFAVAGKVYAGTMTSSPGPISSASSARWSAAVPDETTAACAVPTASASAASNSPTFAPIVSWPLSSDLARRQRARPRPTSGRASRIGSRHGGGAPSFSRYHAIVRSSPSSRSTLASKPSSVRALSMFGIRSSTSM